MISYFINKQKNTIVARLDAEENGNVYVGKSKCNPSDVFDERKGSKLARMRAIYKLAQDEQKEALHQYNYSLQLFNKAMKYYKAKTYRLQKIKEIIEKIKAE